MNCSGCQSIQVTNTTAYRAQGSPTIGQRTGLSVRDVQQTNRLYSCPKRGVTGRLVVHVKYGKSLPDTDPALNDPDPYVKITAVDSAGNSHVRTSNAKSGTTSPHWNEDVKLPWGTWQFFRIQVWDADSGLTYDDDGMTVSETVMVKTGQHNNLQHCSGDNCNVYVKYNYNVINAAQIPANIEEQV